MNRSIISALLVSCVAICSSAAFAQQAARKEVFEGEYIIQRKPSSATTFGSQSTYQVIGHTKFVQLVSPKSRGPLLQSAKPSTVKADYNPVEATVDCEEILKDPEIDTCEPNFVQYLYIHPNDPFYSAFPYQLS
ncbi:MAG: hypothetical protein M3R47_20870, partial [Chloroflexota bacterium]|nr:hypothetical protein [Chloroflexota bacterium]